MCVENNVIKEVLSIDYLLFSPMQSSEYDCVHKAEHVF